jgi:hypothetical protein
MTVRGDSLKTFSPFYKFNCLVAYWSRYNWLQTEMIFAINFNQQRLQQAHHLSLPE